METIYFCVLFKKKKRKTIDVNSMAFGAAPAAQLQSAHRVPITKIFREEHSEKSQNVSKIVVNDAPLSE